MKTINQLKKVENEIEVGRIIDGLYFDPFLDFDEDGEDNGEMVYFMPMLQFPKIDVKDDEEFTLNLLEWLSEDNLSKEGEGGRTDTVSDVHLISGYLNPTNEMIDYFSNIKAGKMSFIGAAPEANSFYNAPFPKYFIPLYY